MASYVRHIVEERVYTVTPGSYIIYNVQKSNLGNVYIILKVVNIDNECNINTQEEWILHSGKVIVIPLEKLPDSIREILLRNRNSLPLFDYIYW